MSAAPIIVWFRQDLRVRNHKALSAAVASGSPVIAVYILDDATPGEWKMGGASRWWLHKSLEALAGELQTRGAALCLRRGAAETELPRLAAEAGACAIYCSRCYEPYAVALEERLKAKFDETGVMFKRFAGALLREPEDVRTKTGDVYKVYSPFWRALSAGFSPAELVPAPQKIGSPEKLPKSEALASWTLLPTKPDWATGFVKEWTPGEAGAEKRLEQFLATALKTYAADRNRPDIAATSKLSPHLHFGEITPAELWHGAVHAAQAEKGMDKGLETFLKEIVWREFSHTLLFYWPTLPGEPFRKDFAAFPWQDDKQLLKAWQRGQTGYPVVDAGMRELWTTGYMHNRVRMIVASFLIKHLLIPWQRGEEWFWDTLVDADLANNAASWQWVAGSGADAAPYFRIFNPVTQGEKFDPDGTYVRRWVPELAKLQAPFIHAPWTADADLLRAAKIIPGKTYPHPLVDHAMARARALEAYEAVKSSAQK